jgi:hypothetical protein
MISPDYFSKVLKEKFPDRVPVFKVVEADGLLSTRVGQILFFGFEDCRFSLAWKINTQEDVDHVLNSEYGTCTK